nr:vWA domain-containing protein [Haloplanus rubicundus]
MVVADTSGSIGGNLDNGIPGEDVDILANAANTFFTELEARTTTDEVRAGLLTFNGPSDAGEDDPTVFNRPALRAGLGPLDQFDVDSDGSPDLREFLPTRGSGNTPTPHALDLARKVLNDQGRPDAKQVIVLATDDNPDYVGGDSPTIPYTVTEGEGSPLPAGPSYTSEVYAGNSDGFSSTTEQDETADAAESVQQDGIEIRVAGIGVDDLVLLRDRVAGDDGDQTMAQPDFFDEATIDNVVTVAEGIVQDIVGGTGRCDEVIFTGSLGELENALTANGGRGIPLDGDRGTQFDELNGDENDENRECFLASGTNCFGLAWWLPENHGNEVQSDSVRFDLGFYTEQCRHNDGSGMNNENVDA